MHVKRFFSSKLIAGCIFFVAIVMTTCSSYGYSSNESESEILDIHFLFPGVISNRNFNRKQTSSCPSREFFFERYSSFSRGQLFEIVQGLQVHNELTQGTDEDATMCFWRRWDAAHSAMREMNRQNRVPNIPIPRRTCENAREHELWNDYGCTFAPDGEDLYINHYP